MSEEERLIFELEIPATKDYLSVLEVSVAGVMRDFGLQEGEGADIANALARCVVGSSSNGAKLYCQMEQTGACGAIKVRMKPRGKLKPVLAALSDSLPSLPSVSSVELADGAKEILVELILPGSGR